MPDLTEYHKAIIKAARDAVNEQFGPSCGGSSFVYRTKMYILKMAILRLDYAEEVAHAGTD